MRSRRTGKGQANLDAPSRLGRNDHCYCGSGLKYKKCHLAQDESAEREELERTARRAEYSDSPIGKPAAFDDAINRVRRYNPLRLRKRR